MTTSAPAQLAIRAAATVGEGPLWDPEQQKLHWVDIDSGAVHHSDLDTGADDQEVYGDNVSALALTRDGSLVAAMRRGYARLGSGPGREQLSDVQPVLPDGYRMNDAKCGPDGQFYAGGLRTDFAPGAGTLWRWDGSGPPERIWTGLSQPNGLAWSPAGNTFYLCDTVQQVVTMSSFDPDTGHLGRPEPLISFTDADGEADGLCTDIEGCLWIAFWGGAEVRRYDQRGRLAARIPVPVSQPSCPAFADGTRLVITSARAGLSRTQLAREPLAGSVFEADPGVAGVPVGRIGGDG